MLWQSADGSGIVAMRGANSRALTLRRRAKRRDVLLLMAGVATWATKSFSQKTSVPVIGYLCPESPELFATRLQAFQQGLGEVGFVEGRNVKIDYRWARGEYSRLPALAAELVVRDVDIIVAPGGAPVALAAKAVS